MDEDKRNEDPTKEQINEKKYLIEDGVFWVAKDIEDLFIEAETEEQTQSICNALCRMIAIIKEKKNSDIDIAKIGKEIQEVLMHDK